VDRAPLTPTEFSSAVTAITSAFGDPTRRDIYLFAHEHPEGVTAGATASQFELHPNVARHHLDKLAAGGYLEVTVERAGAAGRPSKHYRAAEAGIALELPVRHHDILISLLGRALQLLSPTQAEELAEEVGREYGRAMAATIGPDQVGQQSFRSALHTVAEALTAHGFAAHAENSAGELRIVSEHCPFGGAAVEHPVICAVDRGMVQGMLGALYGEASTEQRVTLPKGDDHCVTTVSD
jgi:predicted ArsR family transcriptional regulator